MIIIATIKRPNGSLEQVDMSDRVCGNIDTLTRIFKELKPRQDASGRGVLLSWTVTYDDYTDAAREYNKCAKLYNDNYNEGGEGYMPDDALYQAALTKFPKRTITITIE